MTPGVLQAQPYERTQGLLLSTWALDTFREVINDSQEGVEQVDWARANLAQVTLST